MRLVDGRGLQRRRRGPDGPQVAIVNEIVRPCGVARATGHRPALLHRDRDDHEVPVEVVGVAVDAKYRYISDAPRPVRVRAHGAASGRRRHVLRAAPAGQSPKATCGRRSRRWSRACRRCSCRSFDDAVAIGLTPQRLTAWVAGLVGALGVGLAALGLYGLMAFIVTQRTRELAIRMALGASVREVRAWSGGRRHGSRCTGAVLGAVLAAGIGTLLRGLLVGVAVVDLPSRTAAPARSSSSCSPRQLAAGARGRPPPIRPRPSGPSEASAEGPAERARAGPPAHRPCGCAG